MSDPGRIGDTVAEALARMTELVELAVAALPQLQLGDGGFGVAATEKETGEVRYSARQTAIVLLGLLRAEEHGIEHPFHTGGIRARLLDDAGRGLLGPGTLGLVIWSESRMQGDAAAELVGLLAEHAGLDGAGPTRGSELAWIVTGLAEMGARELLDESGRRLAAEARAEVMARRRAESALFQGPGHGPGRRFQSFEAQIQTVAALSELQRLQDDGEAGRAAAEAATTLISLQREDGSWPALIDVRRGVVVEAYPAATLNQAALAPMALGAVSALTGDTSFRSAALRGLPWIWGRNELGTAMADPEAGTLCRAIGRGVRTERARQMARAAASLIKAPAERDAAEGLQAGQEATPADFGWLLEAWAGARSRGALEG